jgi:hypothetical protein
VPISYELTPANVAEVSLTEELLAEANLGEDLARKVFGDLACRSEPLEQELAEVGISLVSERATKQRRGIRQHIEIAFSSLKRIFGLGETLTTTLTGLATRIAAKICAYTDAFLINRRLGRPKGGSNIYGRKPSNTHLDGARARLAQEQRCRVAAGVR